MERRFDLGRPFLEKSMEAAQGNRGQTIGDIILITQGNKETQRCYKTYCENPAGTWNPKWLQGPAPGRSLSPEGTDVSKP